MLKLFSSELVDHLSPGDEKHDCVEQSDPK